MAAHQTEEVASRRLLQGAGSNSKRDAAAAGAQFSVMKTTPTTDSSMPFDISWRSPPEPDRLCTQRAWEESECGFVDGLLAHSHSQRSG